MKYFALLLLPLLLCACNQSSSVSQKTAETPAPAPAPSPAAPTPIETAFYEAGPQSYDGIGKYYMGREISQVMGHLGAGWLERPEREQEEKGSLMLRGLELKQTDVVADIGAGSGYFTFRMAPMVPQGKVIAVDIQPEMIEIMKQKQTENGITNVEYILGTEQSPQLTPNSVDLVLFVDVYHELAYPREMMLNIVQALKEDGRVVLVEYRGEDPNVPIKPRHKMTAEQAEKEMNMMGLRLIENKGMLPRQHLMIFGK